MTAPPTVARQVPSAPRAIVDLLVMSSGAAELPAAAPESWPPDGILSGPDWPWQEWALCAQTDPEAFFPEKGGNTREAKRICSGCEVRAECRQHALANDERFGVWGGLSDRERRRLRRAAV